MTINNRRDCRIVNTPTSIVESGVVDQKFLASGSPRELGREPDVRNRPLLDVEKLVGGVPAPPDPSCKIVNRRKQPPQCSGKTSSNRFRRLDSRLSDISRSVYICQLDEFFYLK
jgi:hypothetical protein